MLAWAPVQADELFQGCIANGWDCKAQSHHPEVFGRPLLVPGLDGPYEVIAHAPAPSDEACQARLLAVTLRGAALLPDFPNIAVTPVAVAPQVHGVAVRTGPVDEVWLCQGPTQIVLVPVARLRSQVRLGRAVPGAMDPPAPVAEPIPSPPIADEGEMAVAAQMSNGVLAVCRDGTRWPSARVAAVCYAHGGLAAWLTSAEPEPQPETVPVEDTMPAPASSVLSPPGPSEAVPGAPADSPPPMDQG